jgi:uncharacterized protein (DUF4415 family)
MNTCPAALSSCLFDGSAAHMARKLSGKPTVKVEKEKIQLTLDPDVAHKLRCAALGHRMDLSEFVTSWIYREFSSVHIRGIDKAVDQANGAGQGGPPVVTIKTAQVVTNRIDEIARSSTAPRDEALDSFVNGS